MRHLAAEPGVYRDPGRAAASSCPKIQKGIGNSQEGRVEWPFMGIELIKWPVRMAFAWNVGITAALFAQGSWIAASVLGVVTAVLGFFLERD